MGNFFTRPVDPLAGKIVNLFLCELRESGLKQIDRQLFVDHHFHILNAEMGVDLPKELRDSLVERYKNGLRIALSSVNPSQVNYINVYLAHHVMRCLLNPEKSPEPEYTGLEHDAYGDHHLPLYSAQDIQKLYPLLTRTCCGRISVSSAGPHDGYLFSDKLQELIITCIEKIDVSTFVSKAREAYLMKLKQEMLNRTPVPNAREADDAKPQQEMLNRTPVPNAQEADDAKPQQEMLNRTPPPQQSNQGPKKYSITIEQYEIEHVFKL